MNASEFFLFKLNQNLSEKGFKFLKSKKIFTKEIAGAEFIIQIKFDGRGGLTVLDWVRLIIKTNKEIIASKMYKNEITENGRLRFPTMYSQKALDYANKMNLKKLSEMNFEEKYPASRIISAFENFIHFLENDAIEFFTEKHFR